MGKAYEVTRCVDCKHFRTTKIAFTDLWSDKCTKAEVLIESRDVVMRQIPHWCPLPDMPISKMETTTEADR
jgi:hypothetical protein